MWPIAGTTLFICKWRKMGGYSICIHFFVLEEETSERPGRSNLLNAIGPPSLTSKTSQTSFTLWEYSFVPFYNPSGRQMWPITGTTLFFCKWGKMGDYIICRHSIRNCTMHPLLFSLRNPKWVEIKSSSLWLNHASCDCLRLCYLWLSLE